MEIKPVEEEQKLDYPKDEEILQNGKKKRIIETLQNVAIAGAAIGLTIGGIAICKTVMEWRQATLGGVIQTGGEADLIKIEQLRDSMDIEN